ncbi:hypothetical protein A3F66_03210 [candidate division TM6 bacterium RIFCSPHIGHO2_12_FULL_32_22]|nr:MAG: hypothetical protein A3F66_03210 [candidate division TM6 bacterium RIFCSPHIGHO2_12_FULL_32_22]
MKKFLSRFLLFSLIFSQFELSVLKAADDKKITIKDSNAGKADGESPEEKEGIDIGVPIGITVAIVLILIPFFREVHNLKKLYNERALLVKKIVNLSLENNPDENAIKSLKVELIQLDGKITNGIKATIKTAAVGVVKVAARIFNIKISGKKASPLEKLTSMGFDKLSEDFKRSLYNKLMGKAPTSPTSSDDYEKTDFLEKLNNAASTADYRIILSGIGVEDAKIKEVLETANTILTEVSDFIRLKTTPSLEYILETQKSQMDLDRITKDLADKAAADPTLQVDIRVKAAQAAEAPGGLGAIKTTADKIADIVSIMDTASQIEDLKSLEYKKLVSDLRALYSEVPLAEYTHLYDAIHGRFGINNPRISTLTEAMEEQALPPARTGPVDAPIAPIHDAPVIVDDPGVGPVVGRPTGLYDEPLDPIPVSYIGEPRPIEGLPL